MFSRTSSPVGAARCTANWADSALGNAVAIVLCLSFLLNAGAKMDTPSMMLAYFVAAVPFVLSGTILSLAIAETIKRVDRVYFFDLLGAAAGCAVLVPLLKWVGGPNTILVAAVVFAVSAAIWFHIARAPRAAFWRCSRPFAGRPHHL